MFKLILIGLVTYLGYSMYLRYSKQDKIKKSPKSKDGKKYSKMKISDAEFRDLDEK